MNQLNAPDKRKITRWQIDKVCSAGLEGQETPVECRIKDISYKGVRINLRQELPQDVFVRLRFYLADDFQFTAEAWVVWHRRIIDTNSYGLYFSKIADADKENIYNFMLKNFGRLLYNNWYRGLKEGGEEMEDRRVFSRFSAKLVVKFLDQVSNREGLAETADVSAKGLGLCSDEELSTHTPLELWIKVPDKGEPLYTRGEVVWSKKVGVNKFRAGVNLEKADLMGMSRILRAI